MKKISVCIACYNEEDNIMDTYQMMCDVLSGYPQYDYEIIFSDNASLDRSQETLYNLASSDKHVKVIFNLANYGPYRSGSNCFINASGDAVISIQCDMQEPAEMICRCIDEWEKGNLVVLGQKMDSDESWVMFAIRSLYYKIVRHLSYVELYDHVTGVGIIDRQVADMIIKADEPEMSFRHIIPQLGYPITLVPYHQSKRKKGKSRFGFFRYLDIAITSVVRTSFIPLRFATFMGAVCSTICFICGLIYLVYKAVFWQSFTTGITPLIIGVFFIGSVQLLFIGIIGEYVGVICRKLTKRPLVVERDRLNFDQNEQIKK